MRRSEERKGRIERGETRRVAYGATPARVGPRPRYKATNPPSVLYMFFIVANMPGSFVSFFNEANEADWIDNRVRTISRGYVATVALVSIKVKLV